MAGTGWLVQKLRTQGKEGDVSSALPAPVPGEPARAGVNGAEAGDAAYLSGGGKNFPDR